MKTKIMPKDKIRDEIKSLEHLFNLKIKPEYIRISYSSWI